MPNNLVVVDVTTKEKKKIDCCWVNNYVHIVVASLADACILGVVRKNWTFGAVLSPTRSLRFHCLGALLIIVFERIVASLRLSPVVCTQI